MFDLVGLDSVEIVMYTFEAKVISTQSHIIGVSHQSVKLGVDVLQLL